MVKKYIIDITYRCLDIQKNEKRNFRENPDPIRHNIVLQKVYNCVRE